MRVLVEIHPRTPVIDGPVAVTQYIFGHFDVVSSNSTMKLFIFYALRSFVLSTATFFVLVGHGIISAGYET